MSYLLDICTNLFLKFNIYNYKPKSVVLGIILEDFVWQFASQYFFQPVSKLIHIKIICSKIRNTNSKSYLEVYFNIWFYRFIMYYVLTKVELISKTSTPDTNFPSFFPPTLEFWNLVFFLMIFVIEMSFDAMNILCKSEFQNSNVDEKQIEFLCQSQCWFWKKFDFLKNISYEKF